MNLNRTFLLAAVSLLLCASPLMASDWPRWLGPNGDNSAPAGEHFETDLNKWKIAWTKDVGLGYSSVAVVGDRAYTMGHDGKGKETVLCLEAATGKEIWKYSYEGQLIPKMHTGGPNATPTIAGGKVLTLSKDGQAFCLSAEKGEVVWKASVIDALGIKLPMWGFASSAVIDGNRVLFCAGKVVAFDLETGKTLWTSKTANHPGYTSVVVTELDGKKYIAALDGKGISMLNGSDGEEIARHPLVANHNMIATTPAILANGKRIFVSTNSSSEMLGFDGKALTVVWESRDIKNTMNNSAIVDGTIFGIDGHQGSSTTRMAAINAETGKELWGQVNFGYGNTIAIGSTILALTEGGDLVTVKASPDKYTELSKRKVLGSTCWTTPTYANGRIYVRNDQGNVVCLGQ